jgi:DNA-binding NtrC family response regulator
MNSTVDDISDTAGDDAVDQPIVVLVAVGTTPIVRVLPVGRGLELGRRIEAGGRVVEIDDERVSREHAVVRFERGTWAIVDRDSRNGTYVDGARLTGEVRRRADTVVRLGHSVFLLVRDGRGYDPLPADRGDQIVGPELARIYEQVRRHATDPTVLVHGESGSGKELVARLYHAAGPRAAGPFVAVNCAAIPEGVAERLLFGARKGAFSGAQDAVGYLQSAHGGTLFLDEIADLDAAVQAKLLRAIETREVTPVGANAPIAIDLGIIAASHRELRAEVAARRFRDDLYYRLARTTLRLPPLRERRLDIARLVVRELAGFAVHARLVEACCLRAWPGNVRELLGALQLAKVAARAAGRDIVRPEDLPSDAGTNIGAGDVEEPTPGRDAIQAAAIVEALARANGVVSVAARALGLHRTQLYRLMDKHGIARD